MKLSNEFLAALDHFSVVRIGRSPARYVEPTIFITRNDQGFEQGWTVERVCSVAYHVLSTEQIHMLKLKTLAEGLKKHGMEGLYERIMHEPISQAVIRE